MWAGTGMAQEGTDTVCGFRRQDMFKPACLLRDFLFIVNLEGFGKQKLRQAMPPDHIFGALASLFRKHDHAFAVAGMIRAGTEGDMATIEHWLMRMRLYDVCRQVNESNTLHALQCQL